MSKKNGDDISKTANYIGLSNLTKSKIDVYGDVIQTRVAQKLSIRVLNGPCAYHAQRFYVHVGPNQKFLACLVQELWSEPYFSPFS